MPRGTKFTSNVTLDISQDGVTATCKIYVNDGPVQEKTSSKPEEVLVLLGHVTNIVQDLVLIGLVKEIKKNLGLDEEQAQAE